MASNDHSGINAVGRVLLSPARRAARSSRRQLESTIEDVLAAPEVARLVDAAVAGPLAEQLARSFVEHRVLERIGEELARSGELDRLCAALVESPRTAKLVDSALSGPATEQVLRRILAGPELREALRGQTRSYAEELLDSVRRRARNLDDRFGRAEPGYAGVVTRALALGADVLLVNLLLMSVAGLLAIISSFFGGLRPEWLAAALLALGWVVVAVGYFVASWSSVGQTPGMRLLQLRVSGADGRPLSVGRSVVRFAGLVLAVIPIFAGFITVLFDPRRRALPDYLAVSVVRYDR